MARAGSKVLLGFGLGAALTLAAVVCLSLTLTLVAGALPRASRHLALAALVEVVVYAALAWLIVRGDPNQSGVPFARPAFRPALIAAGLGVFVHGPADFIEGMVQHWSPVPESVWRERILRLLPEAAWERAALFVLVAGLVPVVEEVFFRGALFARLRPWLGAVQTAFVTSLCFTLSHVEPRSWPALLCVALVLGALRLAYEDSLWPCVLLHATFNATTLAVVFLSPRGALEPSQPSWGAALVGTLGCAALLPLLPRRTLRAS